MKCLVCGREFKGDECDLCKFPKVEYLGDPEEGIRQLLPVIKIKKEELAQKVNVGIVLYNWSIKDGQIEEEHEEYVAFGKLADIWGKTVWIDREFDVVSEREVVEPTLYIEMNDESAKFSKLLIQVSAPNVQGEEKQRLGISVDEDFMCSLRVQCGDKEAVSNHQFHLFTSNSFLTD